MVISILFMLASALPLPGQERWDFRTITSGTTDHFNPAIAIDAWGNSHIIWTAREPARSTLQLFYTADVSGAFHAPIQASDTGTVDEATASHLNPPVLALDPAGRVNICFIARVPGVMIGDGVFHAANGAGNYDFRTASLLLDSGRTQCDLALDSLGYLHLVWMDSRGSDAPRLYYWTSRQPFERKLIATAACGSTGTACRVGNLDIEAGKGGVVVAYRADSGSAYVLRQSVDGLWPVVRVPGTPVYDRALTLAGLADLRVRMAVDAAGAVHLLYPQFNTALGHRIVHTSDAAGAWTTSMLNPAPFDTAAAAFDITGNGSDRVCAVWTVRPTRTQAGVPRVGFGELVRPDLPSSSWHLIPDLNRQLPGGGEIWKEGVRIAAVGERVVIAGTVRAAEGAPRQIGTIVRSSTGPEISYLFPDAAAPGMSVVVDAVAPVRKLGAFGGDGFRRDTVIMEVADPANASRMIFGPSVMSWDGRLVSTVAFIPPDAAAGPVPVRIRINDGRPDVTSNIDTFFIVRPPANPGRLEGGGVIGSEQLGLGRRSKRGVLVVDSLILGSGTFTIDTTDTDGQRPGNQGFLPVMILSKGRILIDTLATLTVSARHDVAAQIYGTAGPGGGGGGSGGFYAGGSGFTGGAAAINASRIDSTVGTGGHRSALWGGGPSLNGVPGGTSFPDAAGGGGTGHPFGASGSFARVTSRVPVQPNPGGYGGGSGGANPITGNAGTLGGGGGGHALPGGDGAAGNGGEITGSPQLVPLSGGSGGGGGGFVGGSLSSGGGGGGAIACFSYENVEINGTVGADGGRGINLSSSTNSGGGGGGAGGSIIIGAQQAIEVGSTANLSATGGIGAKGSGGNDGGNGGGGRIRTDGRLSSTLLRSTPAPAYQGPATERSAGVVAGSGVEISGAGAAGSQINVFIRPKGGWWNYSNPYPVVVGQDGTWTVTLGPEAEAPELYAVAMQRVVNPLHDEYRYSPDWVMSPVGANILGRPVLDLPQDSIDFSCIRFDSCSTYDITIRNSGRIADLVILDANLVNPGLNHFRIITPNLRVPAGGTGLLRVEFCPGTAGEFNAALRLTTNLRDGDSVRTIALRGCGVSGRLDVRYELIDLGEICPNECRDTVIRIYNRGETGMIISEIAGRPEEILVRVDAALPIVLYSGDSVDVPVTLCPKKIDQRGVRVHIRANSAYPLDTIVVKGTNIGPDFNIPAGINFGELLVTNVGADTCVDRLVFVRNLSARDRLRMRLVELKGGDGRFSVTPSPVLDTTVAPGELLPLTVRFCIDSAGEYEARLHMIFGGGSCEIDTVLQFWGAGILPAPDFVITDPERDPSDPCRVIRFPETSLYRPRSGIQVRVENRGTATGTFAPVRIIGANQSDFSILLPSPPTLNPRGNARLPVTFTPGGLGPRSAMAILSDVDGTWADTICLEGTGAEPGIRFCEIDGLDFGDVRVGDTVIGSFCLFNDGDIADTLTSLTQLFGAFRLVKYTVNGVDQSSLPITIEPGGRTVVRIYYSFSPKVEGPLQDNPELTTWSRRKIVLPLRGRGVLEHIASSTSALDFGCSSGGADTMQCFTVYNTGTHPMVIDSVWVQAGSGRFAIVPEPDLPRSLAVGESVIYCVRYSMGEAKVEAQVVVESTAPERLFIGLTGDVCGVPPEQKISIWVPSDTGAMIGDVFYLPVYARLNRPATRDSIAYIIRMNFAGDLLLPLDSTRPGALPVIVEGTISRFVGLFVETTPGEILLAGAMREGASEGVLMMIPFKVLVGSRYSTAITFKEMTTALNAEVQGGIFHALDCDTANGGIILSGPYELSQNRPNPFNPSTAIPYSIGKEALVRLNLYDATGNMIRRLVDEVRPAGDYIYMLDGRMLPSGVYTCELISGRFRKMIRMVLLE